MRHEINLGLQSVQPRWPVYLKGTELQMEVLGHFNLDIDMTLTHACGGLFSSTVFNLHYTTSVTHLPPLNEKDEQHICKAAPQYRMPDVRQHTTCQLLIWIQAIGYEG